MGGTHDRKERGRRKHSRKSGPQPPPSRQPPSSRQPPPAAPVGGPALCPARGAAGPRRGCVAARPRGAVRLRPGLPARRRPRAAPLPSAGPRRATGRLPPGAPPSLLATGPPPPGRPEAAPARGHAAQAARPLLPVPVRVADRRGATGKRRRRRLPSAQSGGPALRPPRGSPDSARPLCSRRRDAAASAASTQGPRWRAAKPAPTTSDLTAPRARTRPPAPPRRRRSRGYAVPQSGGRAAARSAPPGGAGWRVVPPHAWGPAAPSTRCRRRERAGNTLCRRAGVAARAQTGSAHPLGLQENPQMRAPAGA